MDESEPCFPRKRNLGIVDRLAASSDAKSFLVICADGSLEDGGVEVWMTLGGSGGGASPTFDENAGPLLSLSWLVLENVKTGLWVRLNTEGWG